MKGVGEGGPTGQAEWLTILLGQMFCFSTLLVVIFCKYCFMFMKNFIGTDSWTFFESPCMKYRLLHTVKWTCMCCEASECGSYTILCCLADKAVQWDVGSRQSFYCCKQVCYTLQFAAYLC